MFELSSLRPEVGFGEIIFVSTYNNMLFRTEKQGNAGPKARSKAKSRREKSVCLVFNIIIVLLHGAALVDVLYHLFRRGGYTRWWRRWERGASFLVLGKEVGKVLGMDVECPLETGTGLTA